MKRSEVNRALRDMERVIDRCFLKLPPFCYFTSEERREKGREYDEIRDNMLGWDTTDFGMGDFDRVGFSLITSRNGNVSMDRYAKPYAEKLLYMKEGQFAATYFHWNKMEDITNREGENVFIGVYNVGKEEGLVGTSVLIHSGGREYTVLAGMQIRLCPEESITTQPRLYHDFHLEPGARPVLLGEVSMCNDDNRDDRPYLSTGRFPVIEEDESPLRLLCNEYPPVDSYAKRWKSTASEWKTAKVMMKDMTNVI